jgi:hypothetical protein
VGVGPFVLGLGSFCFFERSHGTLLTLLYLFFHRLVGTSMKRIRRLGEPQIANASRRSARVLTLVPGFSAKGRQRLQVRGLFLCVVVCFHAVWLQACLLGLATAKVHAPFLLTGTRGTRAAPPPFCSASRRTIERCIHVCIHATYIHMQFHEYLHPHTHMPMNTCTVIYITYQQVL